MDKELSVQEQEGKEYINNETFAEEDLPKDTSAKDQIMDKELSVQEQEGKEYVNNETFAEEDLPKDISAEYQIMDKELSIQEQEGNEYVNNEALAEEDLPKDTSAEDPYVGMVFQSYDEVVHFYKEYGKHKGFGVIILHSNKRANGRWSRVVLACCKAGKVPDEPKYQCRSSPKTGCGAKIVAKLREDGLLHLTEVFMEHNHPISPNNSFRSCIVQGRGHESGQKEYRNHIKNARRLKLGEGDAEAICTYFLGMQSKNANFFYSVDFDDEGRLRNVFWADTKSRSDYKYFGDVITFDTTYITNKYDIPFAAFVGVNHHGELVLLGCGLLADETTRNYTWLFKTWLTCMSERPPNAIITDQSSAIKGAIEEIFPRARHRLCLWHIMKKVPEKLGNLEQHKSIKRELKRLVYGSLKVCEFEDGWKKMVHDYGLEKNKWVISLYENRHAWIPVFLKDTFWAGMSTTQRSESINSFFDGYVNSKTSLKQFVSKYEMALQNKYENEARADFCSFHKKPPLLTKFPMEEQLSKLYTLDMFNKFQEELKETINCNILLLKVDGQVSTFEVKECIFLEDAADKKREVYRDYEVLYNENTLDVECICQAFRFKGIICRHALSVLKFQQQYNLPPKYILDRWRKDFKCSRVSTRLPSEVVATNELERFNCLSKRCLQVTELGALSDENFQLAMNLFGEVEKQLLCDSSNRDSQLNGHILLEGDKSSAPSTEDTCKKNKIVDPFKRSRIVRPPDNRKKSKKEKVSQSSSGVPADVHGSKNSKDKKELNNQGPISQVSGQTGSLQYTGRQKLMQFNDMPMLQTSFGQNNSSQETQSQWHTINQLRTQLPNQSFIRANNLSTYEYCQFRPMYVRSINYYVPQAGNPSIESFRYKQRTEDASELSGQTKQKRGRWFAC